MLSDIREEIGNDEMDLLVLTTMFNISPEIHFEDFCRYLLYTDDQLNAGKHHCIILKNIIYRGIDTGEIPLKCYSPSIEFPKTLTSDSVCINALTQIGDKSTSTFQNGYYYWHPSKNLDNPRSASPIFNGKENTTYEVMKCDSIGRCAKKQIQIDVKNCRFKVEFRNTFGYTMNKEDMEIICPDGEDFKKYSYKIVDYLGRIVHKKTPFNAFSIYLKHDQFYLQKGVYFFIVEREKDIVKTSSQFKDKEYEIIGLSKISIND
jgi:hypothetical protein